MRAERVPLYKEIEKTRETKVIAFVTGDRGGLETQIHPEQLDLFVHHLDVIGVTKRITLYLYTRGGSTLGSSSLVHLIRQFCDELEVIVPSKARSGGTLICLGADKIVMTKQATLGPIDPSVNGPLNPQAPGGSPVERVPVSVEAINGYIEFARTVLSRPDSTDKTDETGASGMPALLSQLASHVHPLVLGDAYRGRAQIRMLARRLISAQLKDEAKIDKVLNFLCSESGSHDYAIFRREARDQLGLNVGKPDDDGYRVIKAIYDDIARELELAVPFQPQVLLGAQQDASYNCRRALVESVGGGTHVFSSEGVLHRRAAQPQMQMLGPGVPFALPQGIIQKGIDDDRTFEGWRHEP